MFTRKMVITSTLLASFGLALAAPPAHADEVVIMDPGLAACVGVQPGTPLPAQAVAGVTHLHCDRLDIKSLEGIEAYHGLMGLYVNQNSITDLSPLVGLDNLRFLEVGENPIADFAPLASLTHLEELHLQGTGITDLTSISGLTDLVKLVLHYNDISDVTPLGGLVNLQDLYLHYNKITDVTPLASLTRLTKISVEANAIADISPLAGIATSIETSGGFFSARFQTLALPPIAIDTAYKSPLRGFASEAVTVGVTNGVATVAPDLLSWSYQIPAQNTLTWSTSIPGTSVPFFTGTISQESLPHTFVPSPTTLVDDAAEVGAGEAIEIDVLANDGLPGEPALDARTLALVDSAGGLTQDVQNDNGTFTVDGERILFTAHSDAGDEPSTSTAKYSVTNTDGVAETATIRVELDGKTTGTGTGTGTGAGTEVTASHGTPGGNGHVLATTGAEINIWMILGAVVLIAGGGIAVGTARIRRRTDR